MTVDAIHEATIQVLLADGLGKLTTTRVAQRAGFSVGTLYQYFPNKEALLFAILQQHFDESAIAMEAVANNARQRPLAELADSIADAYVSVKLAKRDATAALYLVAGVLDQIRLPGEIFRRLDAAVIAVLGRASDASFGDPRSTAFTLLSALAGLTRASFGRLAATDEAIGRLPGEARLLARAYLAAAAKGA